MGFTANPRKDEIDLLSTTHSSVSPRPTLAPTPPEAKHALILLPDVTIPIPMPNTTSYAFRCPVHSHLRRAPEGPEQVPHVPGTRSGPS